MHKIFILFLLISICLKAEKVSYEVIIQKEILRLEKRIAYIKSFMSRARLTLDKATELSSKIKIFRGQINLYKEIKVHKSPSIKKVLAKNILTYYLLNYKHKHNFLKTLDKDFIIIEKDRKLLNKKVKELTQKIKDLK